MGNIAAAPFTGRLSDHLGRRWAMWVGCLFIGAGACAQGSATNSTYPRLFLLCEQWNVIQQNLSSVSFSHTCLVRNLICGAVLNCWFIGISSDRLVNEWHIEPYPLVHGFMGGRFCCGFGIGLGKASGITYAAEIAHPAWRSAFTCEGSL